MIQLVFDLILYIGYTLTLPKRPNFKLVIGPVSLQARKIILEL